jgi:hypothetical protein
MIMAMGGALTDFNDLMDTYERPAGAGSRWKGIAHKDLASAFVEKCGERGWEVCRTQFVESPNRKEMCGALELKIANAGVAGISLGLGFLHGNNRRRALQVSAGGSVNVCTNGMVTGTPIMRETHTTGLDLNDSISSALDEWWAEILSMGGTVEQLRAKQLKRPTVDKLLMDAGRNKLMPWSRIGSVDREYRVGRHKEHGKGTAWALYNAFTEVLKKNPVSDQLRQNYGFQQMCLAA